jgi:hypothetical protein
MSSVRDTFDRLKSEVEYPEAWKPEEGESLVGVAVRWEEVTLDRDGLERRTCDVLTLRTEDGIERSVWTWHFVLRDELVGKVEPGDFVAINYRGRKAKQKGDGDYAAYRVAIVKTENTGGGGVPEDDIPF